MNLEIVVVSRLIAVLVNAIVKVSADVIQVTAPVNQLITVQQSATVKLSALVKLETVRVSQ